jgi:uncharacterized membrane protein YphA (DoxX/SURF4 family)
MLSDTQFGISLLVFMFIVSGVDKVLTLGARDTPRFIKRLPMIPPTLAQMIIFAAGIFELIASGMILYGTFNKDSNVATIGSYMLIGFTILATLIFYTFPLESLFKAGHQKYAFLGNLTTIAGLYLMLKICFFKNETLA